MFSVCILTVAPNAPVPLVDVPTPRWICTDCTLLAKSPIFTQKSCELSASFIGTPLAVMLMREGSVPRTRRVV